MCLDAVTDVNKTSNIYQKQVIILMLLLIQGYEKNFHNGLSDYGKGSLYIPIVPTLSEESAIAMITDKVTVDHIPKPPNDRM